VEVIGSRIALKKAGREYMACCPFHNEKTPSFTVSPNKQFYHCFGCGVHGSAISFLMEYENLEYVEAIEALARTAGVSIPREGAGDAPKKPKADQNLYHLLTKVSEWYQQQLPQFSPALNYLQQRGLSQTIIQQFNLGYAPAVWDKIVQQFQAYGSDKLLATGLAIQNEQGRIYDRFRDRIMFPIRDRRGRVIGFGGRVLGNDTPKYLNSPETEVFHKGAELYGLYEARQNTRQIEHLIVVEGYMDVIALAQYGISYAVATLGTATTSEHIQQLFRVVPEIVFCFDGDRAGKQAAWRALENALPELTDERQVKFLFLPTGEDPDTYIRKVGKTEFENAVLQALPLTRFFLIGLNNQLGFRENYTLNITEDRTRFIKEAAELLAKMPDILQKKQLLPELARLGNLDPSQQRLFKQYAHKRHKPDNTEAAKPINKQMLQRTPMRHAIVLLLNFPHLAPLVGNPEQWAQFSVPGLNLFLTLLEIIEINPQIHTATLVEQLRDSSYAKALQQLHSSTVRALLDETTCEREFRDCLVEIKRQAFQQKIDLLVQKEQLSGLTDQERNDLLVILDEIHNLAL
jgi:DNA primase